MSGHQRLPDDDVDINVAADMRGGSHSAQEDAANLPLTAATSEQRAPTDARVFHSLTNARPSLSGQCLAISAVSALVLSLLAVVVVVTAPTFGSAHIPRQHLLPSTAVKSLPSCPTGDAASGTARVAGTAVSLLVYLLTWYRRL